MTSIKQIVQNPAGLVSDVKSKISGAAAGAEDFVRANPITSAATLAGTTAAGLTAIQIVRKKKASSSTKKTTAKKSKKKTSKKKKKYAGHTKRGWKQDRARRSKEKHEIAYQRRKKLKNKKTKKKVGKTYYTKNGQPYKILASGKAKFIKGRRKK